MSIIYASSGIRRNHGAVHNPRPEGGRERSQPTASLPSVFDKPAGCCWACGDQSPLTRLRVSEGTRQRAWRALSEGRADSKDMRLVLWMLAHNTLFGSAPIQPQKGGL